MLTKLDRYIIKKFLTTFFFIMMIIMMIAVIFDVSEKLDDFLRTSPPIMSVLINYYLNFTIYYGNLFSALLIFISVIFFTAKMAGQSEIVAILSSGVSFNRLLRPYFIAATFLMILSFSFNHWLLPIANKYRLQFENVYIRNPYRFAGRHIHKQINPGEFIYLESYNNSRDIGYKFTLEKWDGSELRYKILSDFIRWDTTKGLWTLENYSIRTLDGLKETLVRGYLKDTLIDLDPSDFETRLSNISAMNTFELDEFIEYERDKGSSNVPYYEIEKHQRTSYPFATYILTLIGVSVASRKTRGGIGMHIAIGMLICVSYILAMKVTTVYATNAGLDAFIAVWIPNIMFSFLAVYLFRKAPK